MKKPRCTHRQLSLLQEGMLEHTLTPAVQDELELILVEILLDLARSHANQEGGKDDVIPNH